MIQYSYNTQIDIIDDNDTTTDIADLAYKSAYNYNKTFNSNSSHNSNTTSREYVVSREDFLLLQRIKAQQRLNKENLQLNKNNEDISSSRQLAQELLARDHTYNNVDDRGNIVDMVPTLPPRKPKELSNINPYEERFQRYTKSKYTVKNIEGDEKEERNDNFGNERRPELPRRKTDILERFQSNTKQSTKSRKPEGIVFGIVNIKHEKEIDLIDISDDDNDMNSRIEENNKPKSTMNPIVNRASKPVNFLDSLQNRNLAMSQNQEDLVKTTSKASTHRMLDYLESLQQNPNTTITTKKETVSKPLISSPNHVDYLDSMQENRSTIITKHPQQSSFPSNYKKFNSSKSNQKSTIESNTERFIESALKKSESNYSLSLKKKPLLPNKPNTLINFQINSSPKKIITNNKKEETSNNDHYIKLPQLRKIEKPQIGNSLEKKNQIQEYIGIPELKSVKKNKTLPPPVNKDTKPTYIEFPKLKSLKKDKTLPPPVNKNTKPNLPEALIKHANLKTDDNFPNRHIIKSKTAPAIPSRKISMPEALKRAKELRENRNKKAVNNDIPTETNTTITPTSDILNINSDSDKSLSIEDKLSKILLLQKRHTVNEENPSHFFTYTPTSSNSIPSPSTSNISLSISSENSTPSLNHPTKKRAKGPKRKLPTKI